MTKWSWRPSQAWAGGTGGNCGDPEVCRSQAGSQPRAAPDRQQGPVQFVPLERCLLCLFGWEISASAFLLWVTHDQGCCFSHPVSHSSSPFLCGVGSTHTYRALQPFALIMVFLIYFMGCSKSNPVASSSALQDLLVLCQKLIWRV